MSAHGGPDNVRDEAHFNSLLNDCRTISVRHLNVLFAGIFDAADSALLEFAAKAENNVVQAQFFDAIQEIDRSRQNIKRAFEGEIKIGFAQFAKGRPLVVAGGAEQSADKPRPATTTGFSTGGLELLDKLAHAESAVIQTLAAKSSNRFLEPLYALSQRFAIVNRGRKPEEAATPAAPAHILHAFSAAVRPLRIEPNVKLVLFALFDRVVMSQLGPLYDDLNLYLMKAGVLPNLRPSVIKHPDSGVTAPASSDVARAGHGAGKAAQPGVAQGVSSGPSMGDELFGTIRELLASRRQSPSPPPGVSPASAGGAGTALPYVESTVVLSAISELQVEQAQADPTADPTQAQAERIDQPVLEAIRLHLRDQRQRIYDGVDRRRIPQVEIDVIDVVGMLFDCILNDDLLPNAVKALLSRLHTPYLKIAVLDKKLFTSEDHPARRLLDLMADAGGKWVAQNQLQSGIFPQMQYVVNRVLREFQEGMSLFKELIDEFSTAVTALQHKAELIEQRAREAAEGHNRLQKAKARAHEELSARLAGQAIPHVAQKFLAEIWADHLMLILLRSADGERSQNWIEALRIADEIIWSVAPKASAEEREQLAARLPVLHGIIEEELGSLGGYGKNEQADLFALLKELQTQALQTVAVVDESAAAPEDLPAVVVSAAPVEPEAITPEEAAVMEQLRQLKFGSLFDFQDEETGAVRRLKLSWFSQVSSNYMFVDQSGIKAAVYSALEVARAILSGRARHIEPRDKPFFGWALETIRNMLGSSEPPPDDPRRSKPRRLH